MRYGLALLMLFAAVPGIYLPAAPAPTFPPYAILDIGPPPKGETPEQYRKRLLGAQTCHFTLSQWMSDPEIKKLPCVARFEDPRPWLAKNLRVTEVKGERLLRFTFHAGSRAEQATIINALLRVNLATQDRSIKFGEEVLLWNQKSIRDLEKRIKFSQNPQEAATYKKDIEALRSIQIPSCLADIARRKQFAVIEWAK